MNSNKNKVNEEGEEEEEKEEEKENSGELITARHTKKPAHQIKEDGQLARYNQSGTKEHD
ncbi:hypothetical protein E2C01_074738 [Portunus trituberculatus]|uniref:Uncharacterized protein n=1 Tax=Portunus trituberculatus TaxID=210409 RepID=A0A5B7IEA1_PORTR|nr:hypothetical protein [Portunus trituberculatus]